MRKKNRIGNRYIRGSIFRSRPRPISFIFNVKSHCFKKTCLINLIQFMHIDSHRRFKVSWKDGNRHIGHI